MAAPIWHATFAADVSFPPSLQQHPLYAMLVVMAFWAGALLCLNWIYGIVHSMRAEPAPWRHPITAARLVKLSLLFAAICQAVPRLVMLMAWQAMPPSWRSNLALGSWLIYVPWAALFAFAWLVDRLARGEETHQMRRVPTPMVGDDRSHGGVQKRHEEKKRAFVILVLVTIVAFATTFVRPAARVYHQSYHSVGRP